MTHSVPRLLPLGAAALLALALAAGPAAAQNASSGHRLFHYIDKIKGTRGVCAGCHGEDPRSPPNAMLGIASINPACGRSDWPVGTAHALKGLCAIGGAATQADAENRLVNVGLTKPQMAQFVPVLTAADIKDLAAYLLAVNANVAVPIARPVFRAEGASAEIGTLDFGAVGDGGSVARVVHFANAGDYPMLLAADFDPATALSGLNRARFTVSATAPAGDRVCAASLALAAGERCALTLRFSPDPTVVAGALQTATLTILSNGGSGISELNLNGTRIAGAAPALTLAPAGPGFDAGATLPGTTLNFPALTVTNGGTATLNFGAITLGGTHAADFSRATGGSHCAVGTPVGSGGGTCTLQFVFAPRAGATGQRSATVEIASNAAGSPLRLTLTGTASSTAPLIAFGTSSNASQPFLRLQTAALGATVGGSVTLSNGGAAGGPSLTITNVQLSAGAPTFAISGSNGCLAAALAPGASCTIHVSYTAPDQRGPHTGNLLVTSNGLTGAGAAGPHSVALEGIVTVGGAGSTAAISPDARPLTFGATPVDTLSRQVERVTVVNVGTGALTVQANFAAAQSDFAVAADRCTGVAAGGSCTIDVQFKPRAEGPRSDTLTLSYGGGSLPAMTVTGTGLPASAGTDGGGALDPATLLALAAGGLLLARWRRRPAQPGRR